MHKNLGLFISFFKIGLFTFGGGISMLPLIEKETIQKHHWINEKELLEVVAIAESTPGPIAVNSATYIGQKVNGFFGALSATFAVVLPSFIVIYLITLVLEQFMANSFIQSAFYGIRSGVAILILNAVIKLYKHCPKSIFATTLLISTFLIATFFTRISTIYIILAGLMLGIVYMLILTYIHKKVGETHDLN